MIWPFKPRSPIALSQKVNAERRFAASARMLGQQRLGNCTVLVPQDFDPVITATDLDSLPQKLADFIHSRFPLQDQKLNVQWWDEQADISYSLNDLYAMKLQADGVAEVVIHPELKEFPYRLVAVLAAACAELLVQKESLVSGPLPIGMCETLPVMFGFGPVMANAALFERSDLDLTIDKWEASTAGTINALEYGFSMALADWSLNMNYGEVVEALRLDAKETYTQGYKFLQKTSDCYFDSNVFDVPSLSDVTQTRTRLAHPSQSTRLGTLQDLMLQEAIPDALADSVAEQIRHHEEQIQIAGAYALARCTNLSRNLHDDLLITAETAPVALKRAAISSMRPGYENDPVVVESMTELLGKADASTATVVASTLLKYSDYPDNLEASLLRALRRMVLKLGTNELQTGLQLLLRVCSDPKDTLTQQFEDDPSAQSIFEQLLDEMQSASE